MHVIQAEVRAAIAHPSSNPALFYILTTDVPAGVRGALAALDIVANQDPAIAAKLVDFDTVPALEHTPADPGHLTGAGPANSNSAPMETRPRRSHADTFDNPTAAALSAAETTVAAEAERVLDELQLALVTKAIWLDRIFSIGVGSLVGLAAWWALQLRFPEVFIAVGAAGGALSLLIADSLTLAVSRKKQ